MSPKNEKERAMAADSDTSTTGVAPATQQGEDVTDDSNVVRPGTADVQAYIGRQLRAVYDDVVKQPIPDRFLALMKQLEEQGQHD